MDAMMLFTTATASFTQAHQIIKTLLNLKIDQAVLTQILPLQSLLADAQVAQIALLDEKSSLIARVHNLEQKIVQLETFKEESKRYKLHDVGNSVVAYALKEEAASGEPPHWLCTTCYNKQQKSILTPGPKAGPEREYRCGNCPTTISVGIRHRPEYIKKEMS